MGVQKVRAFMTMLTTDRNVSVPTHNEACDSAIVLHHMRIVAVFLLLLASSVPAQGQKTRPATEADFTGYWRVVLIPDDVHKSRFKNEDTGYANPCQFLIHKADGSWHNISIHNAAGAEESLRQCPTSRTAVDVFLVAPTSRFRWNKLPNQHGLFWTIDTASTAPQSRSALLWKSDVVLTDIPGSPAFDFDLRRGDLIMQLTRLLGGTNIEPVWPMVLRPVAQ
jgi:hypothetical protein